MEEFEKWLEDEINTCNSNINAHLHESNLENGLYGRLHTLKEVLEEWKK